MEQRTCCALRRVQRYVCAEQINDVLCLPIVEGAWVGRGLTPVLVCADRRAILVLDNTCKLAYELNVRGAPTCIHLWKNTGGALAGCVACTSSRFRRLYGSVRLP